MKLKEINDQLGQKFEQVWQKIKRLKIKTSTNEKTLIGTIDNMKIFIVDGDAVKNNINIDFVEGGNDAVYDFIPQNEIWVDQHIDKNDHHFIVFHEFIERLLMKDYKLTYNEAHEIANDYELKKRKLNNN
jgi:hypothetical protein